MLRAPQPNRRRGLLRALGVAVLLVILLAIALAVASAFSTPAAHAPTIVSTPPPLLPRTPVRPRPATPVPSRKKGALGHSSAVVHDSAAGSVFRAVVQRHSRVMVSASASPDGRYLAYFAPLRRPASAYSKTPLMVSGRGLSHPVQVGTGDALVRPIWSPRNDQVMYVRVASASGIPGAHWSLTEARMPDHKSTVLTETSAMNLTPLGWSNGRVLFMVANATDTTLFSYWAGRTRVVGTLLAQPVVSASLSPDGQFVAFGSPTNCSYCTLNLYNVAEASLTSGPTGIASEHAIAWTAGSRYLVSQTDRHTLLVSAPTGAAEKLDRISNAVPNLWEDPMLARVDDRFVSLTDTLTHVVFRAKR